MSAPRDTKATGVALDERRVPLKPGIDRSRPALSRQRQPVQDFIKGQVAQTRPTLAVNPAPGQTQLTADAGKAMQTAVMAANGSLQQLQMQQAMAAQQASYLKTLGQYQEGGGPQKGRSGVDEQLANAKGQNSGNVSLGQFSGSLPDFKWDKTLVQWKGTTLNGTAMAALQLASRILGQTIHGGGWRSHASQVALYKQKPDLAAPPGQSWHELGMAIDLTSKITPQLVKAMKKAGWVQFDAGKEPWHFSYKEPH